MQPRPVCLTAKEQSEEYQIQQELAGRSAETHLPLWKARLGTAGRGPLLGQGLVADGHASCGFQITMIPTTSSSSKTSPTQTRYLSTWPATSARCQSPWESLGLRFPAILSSCLLEAVPSPRDPLPWGSRQTHRLLCLRRSVGVQLPRPRTALAAGRPMSGTPRSTTTSPRTTCRTRPRPQLSPTRPLLLFSPFSKEAPQPPSSLWVILLLLSQRGTQSSHLLYQRRKTNTVSLCRARQETRSVS